MQAWLQRYATRVSEKNQVIKDLNKQLERSHEKGGELLKLNLDKKDQIKRMGECITKLEKKLLQKKA